MDELCEFTLVIEFHASQRPETIRIIARDALDAQEIARRLFFESHTDACVIDDIKLVSP